MKLSTNAGCQRARLLSYLGEHSTITTLEARAKLDVMHPAARVQELREAGNDIITHRRTVNTSLGSHKVAEYVLLSS